MSKITRPSGPKLDLTSGVPDEPDASDATAAVPDGVQSQGFDPAEMTLGELMNLSVPSDDPHMQGIISDEPVPASQVGELVKDGATVSAQPGYSDMINSLAGAHGSFSGAINELAQAGASPEPAAIGGAVMQKAAAKPKSKATKPTGGSAPQQEAKPSGVSPADIKFVSRIRITEAYQYNPMTLKDAPIWVDRNWVGYHGQHDSVRNLEPGPCLRVPDPTNDETVIVARVGDYVVMQDVKIDEGSSIVEIEVWQKDQFERLFISVARVKA